VGAEPMAEGLEAVTRPMEQSTASASPSGGGSFLVWRSKEEFAEEFFDDLKVGCEFIGESIEERLLSFLSLCTTRRKKPAASVPRRRATKLVPLRSSTGSVAGSAASSVIAGNAAGLSSSASEGSHRSEPSWAAFLSD